MSVSTERTTMRGWCHTIPGPPASVLTLSDSLSYPSSVGPNEVLIAISHSALNPGSSVFTQLLPMILRTSPSIPEMDFAGTVVSLGSSIPLSRNLAPGTRVFGNIPVPQYVAKGKGSMAEFVVVTEDRVCVVPEEMPLEQAAGLPIVGCSALCLLDAAKLKEGDRVLVNAASGGVGSLTVQMVKNAVGESGKVVAICSGGNAEMVKGLGADEVIDYKIHTSVPAYLEEVCGDRDKFDTIIDCLGNQYLYLNCAKYLKEGMPYVAIGITLPGPTTWGLLLSVVWLMIDNALRPRFLGGVDRKWVQVNAISNSKQLEQLSALVTEGKLKVPIDSIWDMEDGLKAYDRMLSKHARGKVIVKVKPSE